MIGLKSAAELAENKPHGTRIKYMGGCRCVPCRAANSRYESERSRARREGNGNPIVSAEQTRLHILELSRNGVGRDVVADISGIAVSTISDISSGRQTNCRRMTERAILEVTSDAISGGKLVAAWETWRMIRWLLNQGFTKGELALRLGYKTRNLQINRQRVTARTAARVQRFYSTIRVGEDD